MHWFATGRENRFTHMIGYFFVADILGFGNIVRNSNKVDLLARINSWTTLVDSLAPINMTSITFN
ncbi:MAG: hypothetical protein KAT29_00795 [Anaerolineales bacterium]|nr:hypothetical protein [Anaerolineales bacterium]